MRWKEVSDQEEEVDGYKVTLFSHSMRSKATTALTQPLSPFPKILNLCVRSEIAVDTFTTRGPTHLIGEGEKVVPHKHRERCHSNILFSRPLLETSLGTRKSLDAPALTPCDKDSSAA